MTTGRVMQPSRPLLPPAELESEWSKLIRPSTPAEPFAVAMADHLPAPVRRWLLYAIRPGTPLRRAVVLEQHGTIRLGTWRRFEAIQALSPLEGFIWIVRAHMLGLPIEGFDRYTGRTGEMRHRLFGSITVMAASGPDISRSAAARHTAEIAWVPAAALAPQVTWRAIDDHRATAMVPCGGRIYEPTLTIAASGALAEVSILRWTNVGGTEWHEEPFTAVFDREGTFDGYTIPTSATAGWGYGTQRWRDGAFIHQTIDAATYHLATYY
jgi:hypothetical protein